MRAIVLTCCFVLLAVRFCIGQTEKSDSKQSKWSMAAGMNLIKVLPQNFAKENFSSGFMLSLRYRAWQKQKLYYQSELMFSGQGYEFETSTSTGSVGLGYLYAPQIFGISVHKMVDLQIGLQPGILLVANADSIAIWSTPATSNGKAKDWFKQFMFGLTAGAELHPIRHLTIGGRVNHSFTQLAETASPKSKPSFIPPYSTAFKACWVNVYVEYKF